MSDSPVNEGFRQHGGGKNLILILVFALGVFAGFLGSAALNGKWPGSRQAEPAPTQVLNEPEAPSQDKACPTPTHDETQVAAVPEEREGSKADHETVITPQARDRLLTLDFLNLLQDAELHRYRFEGETKGLKLTKIRTGSFYAKAGFRDGDIIEEVNGLAFADLEKRSQKVRDELPAASQLTFKVRRDDKIITIKIKVAAALKP